MKFNKISGSLKFFQSYGRHLAILLQTTWIHPNKYDDVNFDAIERHKVSPKGTPVKNIKEAPQISEQNTSLPSAYIFYFSRMI